MKHVKKFSKLLFFISFLSSVIFSIYSFPLPETYKIIDEVKGFEPVINKIDEEPYFKEFSGVKYKIIPYANYEIYGLVVEQYDSDHWLDITHRNDPAQTKDLCLIWGENIKNGVYRKAKYSHGEFTCFYRLDYAYAEMFNKKQLTNNHLIPQNDYYKNLLKKVKKGDQVYIKGTLVDYEILNDNDEKIMYRKTSLSLDESKCEVVLLNDFKIIKEENPLIKNAANYSYKALGISLLLNFLLFFI